MRDGANFKILKGSTALAKIHGPPSFAQKQHVMEHREYLIARLMYHRDYSNSLQI